MENVRFCLPKYSINVFEITDVFENNGYREDYDIFNDWLDKFARDFVDCYNNKKYVPFKVKYVDLLQEVDNYYDILVSCNRQDLYDFFDKYLIDTKKNYDINQLLINLNKSPYCLDDIFNEAWSNYAKAKDIRGKVNTDLADFMDDVDIITVNQIYPN